MGASTVGHPDTRTRTPSLAGGALFIALGMAATVGGALAFEHIGGYIPCALCLEQRTPYYVGVPVMLAAATLAWFGRRGLALMLVVAGGAIMAYAAYLGVFHAGVEWDWWAGPADCGVTAQGVGSMGGGDLLASLDAVRPPSCDEAALRVLGLSFAGWQAIAAVTFALASFWLANSWRRV